MNINYATFFSIFKDVIISHLNKKKMQILNETETNFLHFGCDHLFLNFLSTYLKIGQFNSRLNADVEV